jgi:pyruvate/2-oxoglutarate dehydrogenase complex dihydrolipoamide acyltransferase (E2) component/uncharacterized OsmC-like protein
MPKIGEAMAVGTVVTWHRRDGEHIEAGELLVTIETDKATQDLDAPATGTLHIEVFEGAEVSVGAIIGAIGDGPLTDVGAELAVTRGTGDQSSPDGGTSGATISPLLASPKARRLAAELGVDLGAVKASNADGMISAEDVQEAAAAGEIRAVREYRALTGTRRTMAHRVAEAWRSIPHIVQMTDVDATGLLAVRETLRPGISDLTINDIVLHVAGTTLITYPDLNARLDDGDRLVLYEGVDIGFAVDAPQGLVVPVIRGADGLTMAQLVTERKRLVEASLAGLLKPTDMGSASLTVSNLGMFGVAFGTPIINMRESILVFVGVIEDRPAVVDGALAVRPSLTLSIAYDHRIVDGVTASRYTKGLRDGLEALKMPTDTASLPERQLEFRSDGYEYTVSLRSRHQQWLMDEPEGLGGVNRGPDPVSALLGAIAACLTISLKALARKRGIPVQQITGRISANTGQIRQIALNLSVSTPTSPDTVAELLEPAKKACYVSNLLRSDIAFIVDMQVLAT